MRIDFERRLFTSALNFLRGAGYGMISSRDGKTSFVRRIRGEDYPRFHIYVSEKGDECFLDIHLDQKKASYGKQAAHSGEYDGDLVREEAERLQSLMRV